MVWYFIGVYIINRTLHGHLEIRNFSSRVENIFQHSKRNFVSPRGHVISSICPLEIQGTLNAVLLPATENHIHFSQGLCFVFYWTVKLSLIPSTAMGMPTPCIVGWTKHAYLVSLTHSLLEILPKNTFWS